MILSLAVVIYAFTQLLIDLTNICKLTFEII